MDNSIVSDNSDVSINIDETLNDSDNEVIEPSYDEESTKASLRVTLDDSDAVSFAESVDNSQQLADSTAASEHSGFVSAHDNSSKIETSAINLSGDESVSGRLSSSSKVHEDSSKFETSEMNMSGNDHIRLSTSSTAQETTGKFETSEINLSGNDHIRLSTSSAAQETTGKFETSEMNMSANELVESSESAKVVESSSKLTKQVNTLSIKSESAKPTASSNVFNIVDSDDDSDEKELSKIYTIESSDDDEDTKPSIVKLESIVKSEPKIDRDLQMGVKSSSGAKPTQVAASNSSKLNASQLVDDVKPIHLGKTGMETFNYQQSMALKCMDNLCKALDVKPEENKMADNPKQLKIELMPHQRIALTWMLWREEQKPKGGILADDMGLGKTMSMISLILAKLNADDPKDEDQSSDSDDEDDRVEESKSSWIAKGSSSKSYYYGGTLVVCPASIIYQWQSEVANHVKRNTLAVVLHHGSNRETKARHLSKAELVLTTYGIVSSECENQGALFSVKWERVILDEAHIIRNHTSKQSTACCKLKSSARWLLTGTPIQNKEMDLFPLLKFLKCRPFDDLSSFKMWISKTSSKSQERLNQVLQALLLRRTKEDLKQIGQIKSLAEKSRIIVPVQLSTDEKNVYQKVLIYSQSLFTEYLHQKETRNNFSVEVDRDRKNEFAQLHQQISKATGNSEAIPGHHILILILRLRQICIHPSLINAMLSDGDGDDASSDSDGENVPEFDLLEKLSKLQIGSADNDDDAVSKASSKVLLRSNPVFDETRMSSKFQKIIEFITDKLIGTGDKGIVVSQFATSLNMLGEHLKLLGIRFVTLTGQTKIDTRNDIVTKFNSSSSSVQVMLLSLTAGGVGLNLVGANHLFFMDPHWNPQLENQAQDRIYRLGQKKPVTIYKFLCDDTIERRIEKIQENKLQIADQVLTGAKRKTVKLTLDDMKSLFDM